MLPHLQSLAITYNPVNSKELHISKPGPMSIEEKIKNLQSNFQNNQSLMMCYGYLVYQEPSMHYHLMR